MKFSIKDFFSECDQIFGFLRIWSHLLKKSLMENFVFCAVHVQIYVDIFLVRTLPFFLKGGVNFNYLSQMEESEKLTKGDRSMVQGQIFLPYYVFSRFVIFTSRNYFTLYKIVLCIWKKITFFCHHSFMKKSHSKLSKNELF